MKIVIVGAGGAGISAAQTIRQADENLPITVIAQERVGPYSPVSLPYLINGDLPLTRAGRFAPDYFKRNKIEPVLGSSVCQVPPALHSITLANGKTLHYDKLIIASGAVPVSPPVEGIDLPGVFFLDILRRTRLIKEYLRKHRVRQAVVIGAGFTGLEAALALRELGIEITVVELLERVLARILDPEIAENVRQLLSHEDIKLQLGQAVNKITGDRKVRGVRLANNKRLECDMVIVAIGVKPNVEFLNGGDFRINRGIVVDEYQHVMTTQGKLSPDIYAAGDVAETKDFLTNLPTTSAIWINAVEQGRIAALNILGKQIPYEGAVSINVLNIKNTPITGMGLTETEARQKLKGNLEILNYQNEAKKGKFILNDGQIIGFQGIGPWRNTGFIWSCLKKRADVSLLKKRLLKDSPDTCVLTSVPG